MIAKCYPVQYNLLLLAAAAIVLWHMVKLTCAFVRGRQTIPDNIARRRRVRQALSAIQCRDKRSWSRNVLFALILGPTAYLYPAAACLHAHSSVICHQTETHLEAMSSRLETFDSDSRPVGIDNRASACISDCRDDFVPGTLKPSSKVVKVFGGGLLGGIEEGTLKWDVLDDDGLRHEWSIPKSYYVEHGKMRLLSPQHWAQHMPTKAKACVNTHAHEITTEWHTDRPHRITVPIDQRTNVASLYLAPGGRSFKAFVEKAELDDDDDPFVFDTNVVSDDEQSTTDSDRNHPDQEEWEADWSDDQPEGASDAEGVEPAEGAEGADDVHPAHTCDFDADSPQTEHVIEPDEEEKQQPSKSSLLLRIHHRFNHISFPKLKMLAKFGLIPKYLADAPTPTCSACLYAKATRRPWRTKPKAEPKEKHLKATRPGQAVSVDMMQSPTPGLIAQLAGWITGKRYRYATIFVDHYSGFGYVHLQKTQSAEETLEGKELFEREAKINGVKIEHYHHDNGIFASAAWKEDCRKKGQTYSYSGVNAHFQSGIAERRVRELQELARAMLIHAQHRWKEAINSHLWPYALRTANDVYNEAPTTKLKRSPCEVFSNSKVMPNPMSWKTFGCPVYVLDNALQNAGGIRHKWKHRSRVGIYLGRSPLHAATVALVLNLTTGRASPQFHVQFDPTFQTVKRSFGGKSPLSSWQSVCGFTAAGVKKDKLEGELPAAPTLPREVPMRAQGVEPAPDEEPDDDDDDASVMSEGSLQDDPLQSSDGDTLRRSNRKRHPVERLMYEVLISEVLADTTDSEGAELEAESAPAPGEIFCLQTIFGTEDELPDDPLMAYAASMDPDTLYYHEAMREPDREKFQEAMEKEILSQWDNGNFSLKKRSELPPGTPILPGVWALKRKRRILTGEVYKHKGRWNLDGSKQVQGRDYDQTYAPTASWPTIRLMLVMSLMNNWCTKQIDFVQAYPQAPISHKQYVELPKGIKIEGIDPREYVFEAHKNIYGGKDAGRQWYRYLWKKLVEEVGFVESKHDNCLFFKGKVMFVLYTDDSILAGPDAAEIDEIIEAMRKAGLELTVEGTVADFLGVNIQKKGDEYHLTQPRLIQSILEDLHLKGEKTQNKRVPMKSSKLLSRHKDSPPFDGHFNYRRVIGKLNFLEQSTRGDISYATHMCARFSSDPKEQHGAAVKWLGRYLAGTAEQGLIMKADPTKGLEIYPDADFAGAWDPELAGEDIDTARSRHGYIVTYAGAPLLWKSQMQGEVALSSTESEFIGLSTALRTAIPLQRILTEMKGLGFDILPDGPTIHCEAFEDNNGALAIANVPKTRPRTKHINCKYFHFLEYTQGEGSPFSFSPIDTEDQPADMLTKALSFLPFEKHRKWLLGW